MLGSEFARFQKQTISNYHFDSFPYENSYEEDEYEDQYKDMVFKDKWGQKYTLSTNKRNISTKSIESPTTSPSIYSTNSKSSNTSSNTSTSLNIQSSNDKKKNNNNNNNIKKLIKKFLLPNRFNPLKKTTFISFIPVEITMKIIAYLPFEDIVSIQFVCIEWFLMTREEILWKTIYQNYFQVFPNRELQLKKSEKSNQLHWREIFIQQHKREQCWKGDRFKEAHLIGHTGTVWALNMDDDYVYTGSFDKSAKVWDLSSKKCKFTLTGHYYPIQCLDVKNNIMSTGSLDNSIRIWDLEKGKSKGILTNRAHNFDVFCLQQLDNQIISGSSDSTVKVWNINDIINNDDGNDDEQQGHNDEEEEEDDNNVIVDPFAVNNSFTSLPDINNVQHKNIVSVNDKTSRRYNNHNIQSSHTFKHQSCVTCLQAYDNILMSGGSDRVIRVWDLNTSQALQVLSGHNEGIRALQFNGNVLVTGSDDTTIKTWDLRLKNCNISTLRGHNGAIRCIQWDGTTLITGSNDQTVRWWNLNYDSNQSKELFKFNSSISCLKFTDTTLMCGLSDSKVQINKFY